MKEISMTNLRDRPNTALLVIDVQNDVVASAHNREEVIANIRDLVGHARASQAPVIWIQHSNEEMPQGSEGWQYVPDLERREPEPLVHKKYGDSFEDTILEDELTQRRVGRVVITGAQTDACIRATLHGAFTRGYDTVLVGDAHTTDDFTEYGLPPADKVIAHTNMYWTWQDGPGRTASVVDAADVDFHATEEAPS
jgi:nicotinamidase-related amidase